jgi:hypothetical protein
MSSSSANPAWALTTPHSQVSSTLSTTHFSPAIAGVLFQVMGVVRYAESGRVVVARGSRVLIGFCKP